MLASSSKRASSSTTTVTSLPRARRVDQDLHQLRVGAGAVDRLLDRDARCGSARGLVRMNSITGANDWYGWCSSTSPRRSTLEQVAALCSSGAGSAGLERRELEVGPVHPVGHLAQAVQVDRAVDAVEVARRAGRTAAAGTRAIAREQLSATSRRTASPKWRLRQLALERGAQVLHLLLVDEQVAVARDAELVAAAAPSCPGTARRRARAGSRRGTRSRACAPRDARAAARITRGSARGACTIAAPRAAAEGVAALELDDEVEALVEHARERVRRVEPDRRQHRQHLAEEVVADPALLRRGPVRAAREHDALLRQRRQQLVVEQPVLLGDERVRLAARRRRTPPAGAVPSGPGSGRPSLICSFRPATRISKNSSRLVRDDGEEAQALEQRHRRRRAACASTRRLNSSRPSSRFR